MRLQHRGGRKLIMTPEGVAAPAPKPCRDETLVKALVRAHRWRRRNECGQAKSITDLAEQEGVTDAYVCRLLPLTCLSPEVVEAILDGRQPRWLKLAEVLGNGPLAGRSSDELDFWPPAQMRASSGSEGRLQRVTHNRCCVTHKLVVGAWPPDHGGWPC
jgi:hypothetical protein